MGNDISKYYNCVENDKNAENIKNQEKVNDNNKLNRL